MNNSILVTIGHEISKLNPAVVLLLLSWFVGLRLTANLNIKQRQKEFDLATARDFHELYGEFYGIWKVLRSSYRDGPGTAEINLSESALSDLLKQACEVEGKLESTFVRLACERTLTSAETKTLGQFRQLFQKLRESISANRQVPWWSSEHPDYVAFKTLSTDVATLIVSKGTPPTKGAAAKSLLEITSNKWEKHDRFDDYLHG
jgi:hypothetical protein